MTSNWWAKRLAEAQGSPGTAHIAPLRPPPPLAQVPIQMPSREAICPSCHGTNYASAPGGGRQRCFDCGWPIQQSGSGVGSTKTEGPAKKATQVASQGYSPKQIVGRVQ